MEQLINPLSMNNMDPSSAICAELESITCQAVDFVNSRDPNKYESEAGQALRRRIADDFSATFDNYPSLLSWDELNAVWKQRALEDPTCRYQIRQMSSQVHERVQKATVFMEIEITGVDGVNMLGLDELKWRCRNGEWLIFHFTHMRGVSVQGGFV